MALLALLVNVANCWYLLVVHQVATLALVPILVVSEAPTVGQIYKKCKSRHLEAKFTTNASSATWWPKLELIQVKPPLN